jgi:protein-S-isoprenylcysteine O-methyltransferase Ste14
VNDIIEMITMGEIVIAWANMAVLIISALLLLYFYAKSVMPATLEKQIGEIAYAKCKRYRQIAMGFEFLAIVNYVVYYFYPLPIPLPRVFPWDYWISIVIAVAIGAPSSYLMYRGMKDAGEESLSPKKEHSLYGGIYKKVRHPQATGEVFLWWVAAFALNSPFLAIFSIIWLPIFYVMCVAEEKDLVIRYGEAYLEYRRNTGFLLPKRGGSKQP